jgi:KaiC/GvpD/RAD55 family RecA-like ATPase
MSPDGVVGLPAGCHAVTFYDDDRALVGAVVEFGRPVLQAGGAMVVVATRAHRDAVGAGLQAAGVDTARAREEGRLIVLDAADTLATFCHAGILDGREFERTIGQVLKAATGDGRDVRVYGEMVALLWADGDIAAAIELEKMWNRLADRVRFGLLCGYPAEQTREPHLNGDVGRVRSLHTEVLGDHDAHEVSRSFAADITAPHRARAFVAETLRSWQCEAVVDDAVLVASELATNAVVHSRTAFTIWLRRDGNRVRVAVRDGNDAEPALGDPSELALGGRGLSLVASVSDDWGCEPVRSGKTVWADLSGTRAS